jgi:hypothetical protein
MALPELVTDIREKMKSYKILRRQPEGKRPLGRPRRNLEYNIKIYYKDVELKYEDWIYLIQGSCEHGNES